MNNGSELELAVTIMLTIALCLIGVVLIIFIKYFIFPGIKEKIIDNKYNDESNIVRFSYDYGYDDPNIKIITFYKKFWKEYADSHPYDKLYITSNFDPIGLPIIKKFLKEINLEINYDDEMYVYDYGENKLWKMIVNKDDEEDIQFIPFNVVVNECVFKSDEECCELSNVSAYYMVMYKPVNADENEYKPLMYSPHPLHQTHVFERDEIWKEFIKT